ncbi:MAG TPA: GNAT family N-acetyltransferase [Actinospica sp.]|jgi:aminoglycoside 6'-N-acetyltransferase|nr:GNAT family N-acetyltransferase [Actinospica sp.]
MIGIEFRPFTHADLPLLAQWLDAPHVARWWPRADTSTEALVARYGPSIDGADPTKHFLITVDGEPTGFGETYLHADEPDWDRTVGLPNVAGIDYLIGRPEECGRGLGTRIVGAFCDLVFNLYPGIAGIASVPQAANPASRRVLEKNGFRLVDVRMVESDDPGDAGLAAIYLLPRA